MPRIFLVLGLFFLITLPTSAQENRVGIGVSVEPITYLTFVGEGFSSVEASIPTLYVPITLGQFRLEPEIGFARNVTEDETFGGDTVKRSESRLRFATGLFYYGQRDAANAVYAGARLGLERQAFTRTFDGDSDTESRFDFVLAPALGGEHYFGSLSLGVEGQLEYIRLGNFDEDSEVTRSQFQIRALFFARFHF